MYIPVNAVEKKSCWDSIGTQVDLVNLENIIIAGDLNLTLLSIDKRGGSIARDPTREWAEDLMLDWDLLDIKPISGKFTWTNKRIGPSHIAARLDRFLIQSSFLMLGLEDRVHILPCNTSDHKPIKLELRQLIKGSPFFVWEEKLRRVKTTLKSWVKTLPNPANERKILQRSLESHHLQAETADITKEFLDKEAQLHQNFHKACLTEEEYWRLKSRSLWLKVGDINSSFVHKQAQARKCTNAISKIKDGTITHKDNASIKKAASLHFKSLYSEDKNLDQSSNMIDVVPSLITVELNHLLEAKVTKNEVKDPLFDMDPGKALGPDGFTARFLQSC
eukprot:PITA_10912